MLFRSAHAWGLNGNAITSGQFLGTTNNQPLVFKQNNQQAGYVGQIGVAFGSQALEKASSYATENAAFGHGALLNNTSGGLNTAVGTYALWNNTTGDSNTAIGHQTLAGNTTGLQNTALGFNAGSNITSGSNNIAIGSYTSFTSSSGSYQINIGNIIYRTGGTSTANSGNVGIGTSAPTTKLDIDGQIRVRGGSPGAGKVLTSDANGVATWQTSSGGYINGNQTAFGNDALRNRTGSNNTALGASALALNQGSSNIAVGHSALGDNNSGSSNIGLGNSAGQGVTNGSNSIYIGNNTTLPSSTSGNYFINIGNIIYRINGTSAANSGSVCIGTTSTSYKFYVNGSAGGTTAWNQSSDRRLKSNITGLNYGLQQVMQLQPVRYNFTATPGKQEVGFIAQDVKKIIPEVVTGIEGDISKNETLGIAYSDLIPVLTKAIQEQQAQIEVLNARIAALEAK